LKKQFCPEESNAVVRKRNSGGSWLHAFPRSLGTVNRAALYVESLEINLKLVIKLPANKDFSGFQY